MFDLPTLLRLKYSTCPGGGGGGTLIFSYIRRLGSLFWAQNFEFHYFWGFPAKMNIILGIKILWIFFGGCSQKSDYLGVISMHFRVFIRSRYRMGDIYWCW